MWSQFSSDAQTKNNMKRKNSGKKQVSRAKKPKLSECFPIDTLLQNPGYELISRNIFKYLKLEDFSNCRLVNKNWKQFIDEDKYLANVQLTEVMAIYSKRKYPSSFTPFHFVCALGSFHSVKLFLDNQKKRGIDVNVQDVHGSTPLHFACRCNNILVVKQLLNHELNVTLRTVKNSHILHSAALNKDPKVIQAVLESKQLMNIDKNVTGFHGRTVLHYAAENSHSHKPLAYLLRNAKKFNLNVNQMDDYHGNIFHRACGFGIKETVKFVLQNAKKYNIDLNLRNNQGSTPFHHACFYGKLQNVEILLKNSKKHNINVFSINNSGKDGQALAQEKSHTKIVELIADWKGRYSKDSFNQILTQLKGAEKFAVIDEQKKLLDNVTKLIIELKDTTKPK